jgi:uncharacterized membrane protein YhaH (DUF805 family)
MSWWAIFFSFSGRINRAKYWLCLLIILSWMFMAMYISVDVMKSDRAAILALPAVWILYAAGIKRLHDFEKSGWWVVPWLALPFGLLFLGAMRGTPGINRYGADPLGER